MHSKNKLYCYYILEKFSLLTFSEFFAKIVLKEFDFMKIIHCKQCGTAYSSVLKVCPQCHCAKPKNTKRIIAIICACFALFVCLGILGAIFGEDESSSSSPAPSSDIQTAVNSSEPPKETKEEYLASCETISYEQLVRNPDDYAGKRIAVKIGISQILTKGILSSGGYRGYEDYEFSLDSYGENGNTYLQKEWFISYDTEQTPRILENDTVVFYGEYSGLTTMKRALTRTKEQVPLLNAEYHEILK